MKTVLVVGQKGGTGKTTISLEIYAGFGRAGVPARYIDLDAQGGTIYADTHNPDAEVAIIDTPGSLQSRTAEWMQSADMIILPTLASPLDMEPLLRVYGIFKANANDTPILVVVNCYNRFRMCRDFVEWLARTVPGQEFLTIADSEIIKQAVANRKSVVDYAPKTAVAVDVAKLCSKVQSIINLPPKA